MTRARPTPHPHDVGLPPPVVKQRRRARYLARWMLLFAILTAVAGWPLFGTSVVSAFRAQSESPYRAIVAYVLLIVSSATLILGLWYLLVAQVNRVARMVEEPSDGTATATAVLRCKNCGWPHDPPDRFCRHCGKPLPASSSDGGPAAPARGGG